MIPALAEQRDAPDLLAHRLDRLQHLRHALPSEFGMADIDHAEFLIREIQWRFPGRIVDVKEERLHVRPLRAQRRLADLVAQAVADLDPLAAQFVGFVIVVAAKIDPIVVRAVAVDHDATGTRDGLDQADPVQPVAKLELCRPLEHKDHGVRAGQIERVIERKTCVRRPVDRILMTHRRRRACIAAQVHHAACVLITPIDEYDLHR